MKNYKKVYAAFILAGGLILHGCNGIFDDLAINPNQPSMGAYFLIKIPSLFHQSVRC